MYRLYSILLAGAILYAAPIVANPLSSERNPGGKSVHFKTVEEGVWPYPVEGPQSAKAKAPQLPCRRRLKAIGFEAPLHHSEEVEQDDEGDGNSDQPKKYTAHDGLQELDAYVNVRARLRFPIVAFTADRGTLLSERHLQGCNGERSFSP